MSSSCASAPKPSTAPFARRRRRRPVAVTAVVAAAWMLLVVMTVATSSSLTSPSPLLLCLSWTAPSFPSAEALLLSSPQRQRPIARPPGCIRTEGTQNNNNNGDPHHYCYGGTGFGLHFASRVGRKSNTSLQRVRSVVAAAAAAAVGIPTWDDDAGSSGDKIGPTSASATTAPQPPMSREEVQVILDRVPVYGVTSPEPRSGERGLVLLRDAKGGRGGGRGRTGGGTTNVSTEGGNGKEVAYFFFNPETAKKKYEPLLAAASKKGIGIGDSDWEVTAYPLGLVWFELVASSGAGAAGTALAKGGERTGGDDDDDDDVEYRIIPDAADLEGARSILAEQQARSALGVESVRDDNVFAAQSFNEIPVFIDRRVRIGRRSFDGQAGDDDDHDDDGGGGLVVPMYLSLQDAVATGQRAKAENGGDSYGAAAALTVVNLRTLVDQMQQRGAAPSLEMDDFRRTVLLPPSSSHGQQQPLQRRDGGGLAPTSGLQPSSQPPSASPSPPGFSSSPLSAADVETRPPTVPPLSDEGSGSGGSISPPREEEFEKPPPP